MKLSDSIIFLFTCLLCMNYTNGQSVDSKSTWSGKLIDPIAVDSVLVSFVANLTISSGIDTIFYKQPKHVRQFSKWSGYGDDPIVMKGDTVYIHTDVHFDMSGKMTKFKDDEDTYFYYYDEKGNIVYREIRPNGKDRYSDMISRVERMSYDKHGNLLTYYEYEIAKDSVYSFEEYKEYAYQKQGSDITVTIKGLEKRGYGYLLYTTTKKFDNAGLIQTQHRREKSVSNERTFEYTTEYSYETIKGKSYLQSEKSTYTNQFTQYSLVTYVRDTSRRLLMKVSKTVKSDGYTGYKHVFEYPKKNTKITKLFFETTIPKEKRGTYYDMKEGLQKTFIKTIDEHGNITKDVEIFLNEETTITRSKLAEYTFDAHLSWTTKTLTDKLEYTPKIIDEYGEDYDTVESDKYYREITYFSSTEKLAKPPTIDKKAEQLKDSILLKYFK